jgi:hypothetical protein
MPSLRRLCGRTMSAIERSADSVWPWRRQHVLPVGTRNIPRIDDLTNEACAAADAFLQRQTMEKCYAALDQHVCRGDCDRQCARVPCRPGCGSTNDERWGPSAAEKRAGRPRAIAGGRRRVAWRTIDERVARRRAFGIERPARTDESAGANRSRVPRRRTRRHRHAGRGLVPSAEPPRPRGPAATPL